MGVGVDENEIKGWVQYPHSHSSALKLSDSTRCQLDFACHEATISNEKDSDNTRE